MRLEVQRILEGDIARLRREINRPQSLLWVSRPILTFEPQEPGLFDEPWTIDRPYPLKLKLLGLIPLGGHVITLRAMKPEEGLIISEERGGLAKVWNHTITFEPVGEGALRYVDVVEIKAGLLTLPIWCFAQIFYRHRQRRWQALLRLPETVELSAP